MEVMAKPPSPDKRGDGLVSLPVNVPSPGKKKPAKPPGSELIEALAGLSKCVAVRGKKELAKSPRQSNALLARQHHGLVQRSAEVEIAVKAKRAELEETLIRIEVCRSTAGARTFPI